MATTIADKLNNPGNLKDPSTGSFQQFNSPQEGFAALLNDLQAKISPSSTHLGPKATLADFSKMYAPASDNNDPAQYTANLANRLKVRPDTTLGELQPRIGEFAQAVAHNEGYSGSMPIGTQSNPPAANAAESSAGQPNQDNRSIGGFLGNVVKSGGEFLGGIGQAIMHPIKTVENIGQIGVGELEQLTGVRNTPEAQLAGKVNDFYGQRYGGFGNIENTLYTDPVGAAADISTVLGGAGAIAGKLGKVSELGSLARAGEALSTASDVTNPLAIPGKVLGKTSDLLKSSSNKSYEQALAATTKQNKFLTEPIVKGRDIELPTGEKFHVPGLIERGKTGSLENLSDTAFEGIRNTKPLYEAAEQAIPGSTKIDVKPIIDQIEKAKEDFTIQGAKGQVVVDKAAVKNLTDFQKTIKSLSSKGLISKESLTELKSLWQKKVAKSGTYYGKTLAEGSQIDMLSTAEKAIRRQLDSQFPEVAKINAEYKFWKDAQKVINDSIQRKKGQTGVVRRGLSGIVGIGLGSSGGFLGSTAGLLAMELLQEAMHSARWKTISSIVKDRIANALVNQRVGQLNLILRQVGVPVSRLNLSSGFGSTIPVGNLETNHNNQ